MESVVIDNTYIGGGIIIIKINRPQVRNAVDRNTADQLAFHFKRFNQDAKLNVAILYGGEDMFCSGADLKQVANSGDGGRGGANRLSIDMNEDGPMGPTRLVLDKPVIAAIGGGYCVAGGLELALWCDMRVSSRDSIYGVYCRRWGVPLIDGGTIRLPRLIGLSRAMDLILTGRSVSAQEAYDMGLVNRLVDKGGNVLEEAVKLAKIISSYPQQCLRSDRKSTYDQYDHTSLQSALSNEFKLGLKSLNKEGVAGATQFTTGGNDRYKQNNNNIPSSKL